MQITFTLKFEYSVVNVVWFINVALKEQTNKQSFICACQFSLLLRKTSEKHTYNTIKTEKVNSDKVFFLTEIITTLLNYTKKYEIPWLTPSGI